MLKRFIKSFLFIALGCGIGVFLSQYSYFTLSKEISLTEILIAILTAIVALYIADDLSARLFRSQSIKTLFISDIKTFIVSIQILENWIEEGICSAKDLKGFLKSGTLKLNNLLQIYGKHKGLNSKTLVDILNLYNTFKNNITIIPPSANGKEYKFNPEQQHRFSEQLNEIKVGLLDVLVKA
jgi:hypothetical protein